MTQTVHPPNANALRRSGIVLLAAACAVLAASAGAVASGAAVPAAANRTSPVAHENTRPGTTAWDAPTASPSLIDAYLSDVSAAPGQTVALSVSAAPGVTYRVEVYRLGWYGGKGGRLVTCLPSCSASKAGSLQPIPPRNEATGELALQWPETDSVAVGSAWTSGYYLVNVLITAGDGAGTARHVPLIVRESGARPSAVLALASVNTWQAYNDWGGKSLYVPVHGAITNSHVSFDRPYNESKQNWRKWELPAIHYLERFGYDVSYAADLDLDRDPGSVVRHRLVMTLGHGEYWTSAMRTAFERGRDAGTNLAFLGGNTGFWQMRYANDRRTIVEYRHPENDPEPDPALKTTTFRELTPARPECELLGVSFGSIGDTSDVPVVDEALSDPWFAGTGFTPGSVVKGIGGYEWDGIEPGGCRTPPLTVFFHEELLHGAPAVEARAWNLDVTRYTAPSGARVFSGSTMQFSWALDIAAEHPDPRLIRFMNNALDDMTRPAPPRVGRARFAPTAGVVVSAPRPKDVRVTSLVVLRHRGAGTFDASSAGVTRLPVGCARLVDAPGPGVYRYAVAYQDRWRASRFVLSAPVVVPRSTSKALPRCVRGW